MRWSEISEAPLADFGIHGDLDREGSYRPDDLKAMSSPKWRSKVERVFSRSPFLFNLYLLNLPDGQITSGGETYQARDLSKLAMHSGLRSRSEIEQLIGRVPPAFDTSINVVLVENEGGARRPLSPWILAHRVVHALLEGGQAVGGRDSGRGEARIAEVSRLLFQQFDNLVAGCCRQLRLLPSTAPRFGEIEEGNPAEVNVIASLIGTIRSLREGNLANRGEFVVELVTQYLVQGGVRLQCPDLDIDAREMQLAPGSAEAKRLAMAREAKSADAFALRIVGQRPSRPQPFVRVYDAAGKIVAASTRQSPHMEELAARPGHRLENVVPTKQQIARFESYQSRYDKVAAQFAAWQEAGYMSGPTSADLFDQFLARQAASIDEGCERLFKVCVGRALCL